MVWVLYIYYMKYNYRSIFVEGYNKNCKNPQKYQKVIAKMWGDDALSSKEGWYNIVMNSLNNKGWLERQQKNALTGKSWKGEISVIPSMYSSLFD